MKRKSPVACDTGPLVALFEPRDANHQAALAAAKTIYGSRFTVWPVITAAAYFLRHDPNAIRLLLREIEIGNLSIVEIGSEEKHALAAFLRSLTGFDRDLTSVDQLE